MVGGKIVRLRKVRLSRLAAFSLALLLLLCGVYVYLPSIRARYLFSRIGTLQVGRSSFDDAQRLAERLGAKPADACDRSDCYWTKVVDNVRLPKWWRGPGVTFVVDIAVKNSVVVNRGAFYAIGTDPYTFTPSMVSVGVKERWAPARLPTSYTEPPTQKGWSQSSFYGKPYKNKFVVMLTPRTSIEDTRRYTAFNYSCFWKFRGCKDATELLPTADPLPVDK